MGAQTTRALQAGEHPSTEHHPSVLWSINQNWGRAELSAQILPLQPPPSSHSHHNLSHTRAKPTSGVHRKLSHLGTSLLCSSRWENGIHTPSAYFSANLIQPALEKCSSSGTTAVGKTWVEWVPTPGWMLSQLPTDTTRPSDLQRNHDQDGFGIYINEMTPGKPWWPRSGSRMGVICAVGTALPQPGQTDRQTDTDSRTQGCPSPHGSAITAGSI